MGRKKEAKPATCDVCGYHGNDSVILLTNPDPIQHEVWCDHCYTSSVIAEQEANKRDKQK